MKEPKKFEITEAQIQAVLNVLNQAEVKGVAQATATLLSLPLIKVVVSGSTPADSISNIKNQTQ